MRVWKVVKTLVFAVLGLGGLFALACFVQALAGLRSFEWAPLGTLLGWRGVIFVGFLASGLAVFVWSMLARAVARQRRDLPFARTGLILFGAWTLAILWLADWTFLERPLTSRVADVFAERDTDHIRATAVARFTKDGSLDALATGEGTPDRERLALMLARISVNRPSVFDDVSIGRTIQKYAKRYDVNPVLLLHWVYIDSFYGESPPGPMPFFAEINPEMFRDQVQAHLPAWFIESRLRVALIEGPWLDYAVPHEFATKLRYAFQKATYDIAISPFMNSVYSDLFVILKEYPDEFPELFADPHGTDPLAVSFRNLEQHTMLRPYDAPYALPARDSAYYDRYREDLITFARAAVYRLGDDFEFAAKSQALIAKYYTAEYSRRLGAAQWQALSPRQQTALLAMLRDVYVPNIGRVSYNLYMVPEFNCTPITFLVDELQHDPHGAPSPDKTWTPPHRDRMWGATGLMLRVLGEVWQTTTGEALPGIVPTETISDALIVIARHQ